jgi:tRNA (cytidine/uridine-2'-O-)-methyltransferase
MRIALYQPEIPQNVGTIIRTGMCLSIPIDIIHPCGFVWSDKKLHRAGMDYVEQASVTHHYDGFEFFMNHYLKTHRIVLVDVNGRDDYTQFQFQSNDILLMGRESDGVPDAIFNQCHESVKINTVGRSLNVAIACAMVVSLAQIKR